jgi:hypothetical protein
LSAACAVWQPFAPSQQPLAASHAAWLQPEHCPAEQLPVPQFWQPPPPEPHAFCAVPGWQASFESQHPPEHEAVVHTQAPPTHSLLLVQGPFVEPHTQLPLASQALATGYGPALHALHEPPPEPQWPRSRAGSLTDVRQSPLSQQPIVQPLAKLHMHAPPLHTDPWVHGAPRELPQVHFPSAPQRSDRLSQAASQAAPGSPQFGKALLRLQVPDEQQPLLHAVALHWQPLNAVHSWPSAQTAPPSHPHAPFTH